MFTGIIEEIGIIQEVSKGQRFFTLKIQCSKILDSLRTGDSVAVNGVCLTVTGMDYTGFSADVMPETLSRSSLKEIAKSSRVNLERALQLTDRLGGHIVSGHIDGTGVIKDIAADNNAVWLTISAGNEILKYIVLKGSVAIDGTSLTVARVDEGSFKVSLIPLTRELTVLGGKKTGDMVNIECDIIGKYVEKLLNNSASDKVGGISLEFLSNNGFL